jgi:uncharacterized protein (TIGR02265 family)
VGVDLPGKLRPAYEKAVWLNAARLAGELLFPGRTVAEQQPLLGQRFMAGFADTLVALKRAGEPVTLRVRWS